jgi:ribokinase
VGPVSERPGLVVVGAINVDLVVSAGRLPGPGETVVGSGPRRSGGGKGANAAVAAARSGARVSLVGAVGHDGEDVLADLVRDGVDVDSVARLDDVATGVALIVVDGAGENQIAVGSGANGALTPGHVRLPEGAGSCLVSTEIPDDVVEAAVSAALAAGLPCVLNPAPPTAAVGRVAGRGVILTPNRTEAAELGARLLGRSGEDDPQDPVALARSLSEHTGAPVVMTLGAEGVVLVGPGLDAERIRARPAPVVRDTTGAGDTFNGVFAAGLAHGLDVPAAARRAVVAATLSVGRPGARAGMPTAGELRAASA